MSQGYTGQLPKDPKTPRRVRSGVRNGVPLSDIDPETGLSRNPQNIRARIRRRGVRLQQDLETYVEVRYTKPLDEWDLEELARGRTRHTDGTFKGQSAPWITPLIAREAQRRLLAETMGGIASHLPDALKTVARIMESKTLDENGRPLVNAETKLKAAIFIIESIKGKPKAVVEVEGTDMVRQFLAQALVLDDGTPAHPVVDGQFYEDDDEGADDAKDG